MTPAALRQLLALAEARKGRALLRLQTALREDRRLAAEAEDLARAPAADFADPSPPMPLAQYGLRLAWADQRLRQIRLRRADLAREIAGLRATAATSLGKHRALEHLTDHSEAAAERLRLAREDREAPPAGPFRPPDPPPRASDG